MGEVNPAGTMFVGLIPELMHLVADPNVSRVEVVIGSYDLDEQGNNKLIDGKESVTTRAYPIRSVDKPVRDNLRAQLNAVPFTLLMVLWIDRVLQKVPGMLFFDASGKKRTPGVAGMDHLEKSVMADYLTRQVKNK